MTETQDGGAVEPTVRIYCPFCGGWIRQEFNRYAAGIPLDGTHKSRGGKRRSSCRVIVEVDPFGDRHRVQRVPDNMSVRVAIKRRMAGLPLLKG